MAISAPQRRGGGFVTRRNLPLDRRPDANELDRIQLAGQRCPPMTWRGIDVGSPTSHRERRWESFAASAAYATQVLLVLQNNIRTLMDTAPNRTLLVFESHRLQQPPESGVGNCRPILDVVLASLENRRHNRILLAQEQGVNFPAAHSPSRCHRIRQSSVHRPPFLACLSSLSPTIAHSEPDRRFSQTHPMLQLCDDTHQRNDSFSVPLLHLKKLGEAQHVFFLM